MSFQFIKQMPTPEKVKTDYPISPELAKIKESRDAEIKKVFTGENDKFLLIIGPCSADNEDSVADYCNRLAKVQEKVKDKIICIPRIYTNKPRTTGMGYKGMLHQPDPEKKPDLLAGLAAIRKMHIRILGETGLSAADEMLYPENYRYVSDILSYVAIGARSVEDQQHRLTVSGMDVPAGMKNPTSGDLSVMINSVVAAQSKHTFIYGGYEVKTSGNELAHTILRGAVNKHGQCIPNYHYEDLIRLSNIYAEHDLKNPAVIVDCNHSNSGKQFKEQIRISKEVLHSMRHSEDVKKITKGLMIESYIEEGCQKVEEHIYGKSITDPCLGWDDTEKLILEIADLL
ncbi:MAG: 3-deoxy-7-phosphoheptulonate synthase [Lachnospiraceae bacterium]|nr:3-deoxy-7-phosphoheptulonate synthase [Lachnospiraceae bacterium]MBQ5473437.1 3-deoxy-7-phosphoheptulonate synthase [Lachnospiraceae bacterium]